MIEALSLTRRFGATIAVCDISFVVPDGGVLALLGPNGAGKTTTVRMLAGLLAPSAGGATVAGFDVRRAPDAVRARSGLVTDSPALYEQMALADYLEFFGALYGLPPRARRQRAAELIDFFDLGAHRTQRLVGFSKGMKQKVALARALLHDPAALFLDEPTAGLDPLAARDVRQLIEALKHAQRSILLCTHDLDEAERLAETIVIMQHGAIRARGTPQDLRAQSTGETVVTVELAAPLSLRPDDLALGADPPLSALQIEPLRVTFHTLRPQDANPAVVAALVGAGARIVAVSTAAPSLEDVYAAAVADAAPALAAH